MDFSYFYKFRFQNHSELNNHIGQYDYFITMYHESDRVKSTSENINANHKICIISQDDAESLLAANITNKCILKSEEGVIELFDYFQSLNINNHSSICIDSTGFITPILLTLLRVFSSLFPDGISISVIYTEPQYYTLAENTIFSDLFYEVSQISGYGGIHTSDMSNDILIIGSGYDFSRVIDVANKKKEARKIQLYGFPAMQPDMFQQNILQSYKAESALGPECFSNLDLNLYAPASDPFIAAQSIQNFIDNGTHPSFTNIYFAPLSSKPHSLGMAIYYIWNKGWTKPMSIIYPKCKTYNRNCAVGIGKIWLYSFELPSIR